ncbi:MAG TPA: YitT family protein [Candidatus Paraprevotella stercorigallinarum]|nr:YitT family protein [Candidatus Paraprevotella stercorigallinarum]
MTEMKDFLAINVGLISYAIGWAAFLLPYKMTTGGLTGMCAIFYYLTDIPIQLTFCIVNVVLILLALRELGYRFVIKTTYAIFMLSFFLDVAQNMMKDDKGQFLQILGPGQDSMACILGAILCGFGIGIVFVSNGSTGGTDIIAAVVNKHRNISLGRVLLYIDLVTISSCYFFFNDWRMVVFGYVALVVMNYTLDMVVNSSRQDVQFIIFTKKYQMLSDRIINETCHSVTVWDSEGYYTHTPIKVMITIVHKNEAIHILRMIHEVDPEAFVSQSRAEGVYGNGFNSIKIK